MRSPRIVPGAITTSELDQSVTAPIITPRNNEEIKAVVQAKCGHIFHKTCIVQWVTNISNRNMTCPNCRTSLNPSINNNNNNQDIQPVNNDFRFDL